LKKSPPQTEQSTPSRTHSSHLSHTSQHVSSAHWGSEYVTTSKPMHRSVTPITYQRLPKGSSLLHSQVHPFPAAATICDGRLQLALTAEQKKSNTMLCTVNRPLITIRFSCYGAAVFSLAAMSIERWYAICQPFAAARKTSNKKRLKFTAVFVIWVLAVGVSWPLLLCSFGHERVHTIVLAVSFLVLPFLAIVVANGKIILSIKKAGLFVVSRKIGQETRRRRKHLLNLLFAIIISFVVLWLPYTALYVFMGFVKIKDLVIYLKLMITARAVAITSYIHPALNSFLYYGFCRDFRRGLASLMRKSTSRTTASRN